LKKQFLFFFSYVSQRDIFLKLILFSVGSFFVLDLLRSQSVEIELLQLTPGLYLAFVFLTYIVLFICSRLFLELSFRVDNEKATGTKSLLRSYVIISRKINVFFSSMSLFFSLTILLPISLEYFINSIQKTLENLWSLQEFLGIELIFFVLCTFLFQFPIFFYSSKLRRTKNCFFSTKFQKCTFYNLNSCSPYYTNSRSKYSTRYQRNYFHSISCNSIYFPKTSSFTNFESFSK